MRLLRMASAFLLLFITSEVKGQMQTQFRVEAFGGVRETLRPIPVPPQLKSFVPPGFTLRALLETKIHTGGEKLLLYDNGADTFPEVHLHAIRKDKDEKLFDGEIAGVAGLLPVDSQKDRQMVSFAYHKGFDAADTRFMIFGVEQDSYKVIFEGETTTGQMRILSESPFRFELWSADWDLDEGESCVWCAHRYLIRTYVLRSGKFSPTGKRITKASLNPAEVAEKPFVMGRNKQ